MCKYFTENERYKLETMLKDGISVMTIAERLNKHFTTIYKEIKKGTVKLLNSDLTFREEYCADRAQAITVSRSHNKGISVKIGFNHSLADYITHLIKDLKYSPYAVSVAIKNNSDFDMTLCETTIYNYVHNGFLLNVSDDDLHYNLKKTKDVTKTKRPSYKKLRGKSIEDRPKNVYKRDSYGHWEMDTVYSGKGKGKACLLVLTERMTLDEIIIKMPDRTLESTINALDTLERSLGADAFRNKFLTVTIDNGSEFGDSELIERSCLLSSKRTTAYFCHPFSSSERGSNENVNGLIRYWIPKGDSIEQYSDLYIKQIETWINNYPRKKFCGLSSAQYKLKLGIP